MEVYTHFGVAAASSTECDPVSLPSLPSWPREGWLAGGLGAGGWFFFGDLVFHTVCVFYKKKRTKKNGLLSVFHA